MFCSKVFRFPLKSLHRFAQGAKVFYPNVFQCFVQRLSDFRSKALSASPKALSASPKALTCFAQSLSEFCLKVFVLSVGSFLRIVR